MAVLGVGNPTEIRGLIELSTGLWNPTAVGQCNIAPPVYRNPGRSTL